MDYKQHTRADYLRDEISKIKDSISNTITSIQCGTSVKIDFNGRSMSINQDYTNVVRGVAAFLKESLEKELKRLEKEYSEL